MKARQVTILHALLFGGFTLASLGSTLVALFFPEPFPGRYLVFSMGMLFVLVLVSWRVAGGCPLTTYENTLREKERLGSGYSGGFLDHYAFQWFGITIPRGWSTVALVLLFVLSITVGTVTY